MVHAETADQLSCFDSLFQKGQFLFFSPRSLPLCFSFFFVQLNIDQTLHEQETDWTYVRPHTQG